VITMAHVAEYKKKIVKEFVELINEYPIIGAVNMENMPAKQLQNLRAILRDNNIVLKMTKRRLMKIAFEKCEKKDMDKLLDYLEGMPALIFTKENPFKLSSLLRKNKSNAPAKAGQKAPKDIMVQAGGTPFAPGPIISQLGKVGIKTGIEAGKIVIKEDAVVAKKGEKISADLAGILARLGIEPMEIGLSLIAVYEDGTIFTSDILSVDETVYIKQLVQAVSEAKTVAIEITYPTTETIQILLSRAYNDSKAVALSANIVTKDTVKELLAKANAQSLSLSSLVEGN